MSAETLTTISTRQSTRAALQRLKTGGQSYDEVIRAILEELEESDPWFAEMEQRLSDIHPGKVRVQPIDALYARHRSKREPTSKR